MNCFYHPDLDATNTCSKCGQAICSECNYVTGTHPICRTCWDKHVAPHRTGMSSKPAVTSKPRQISATKKWDEITTTQVGHGSDLQRQNTGPLAQTSQPRIDSAAMENTSGLGKAAIVPYEIKGWNWGAFLMTWIWGIGNKVWIALIVFIPVPFLALIMCFVLGAKGNQWAWQRKVWASVEDFKRTQRTWRNWGIGLLIVSLIIYALFFILGIWTVGDFAGYTY